MANLTISRVSNGKSLQDVLSDNSLGLNHGFSTNDATTLEVVLYIRHDSNIDLTNVKLYIDGTTDLINWADATINDGILLDLDNDNVFETNISSLLGNTQITAIALPDLIASSEKIIRVKIKVPESETTTGTRLFNIHIEYTDSVFETFTLLNNITFKGISETPCDGNFLALLPQKARVIREYSSLEGVHNRNTYGEIIKNQPNAQVIAEDVAVRIEFIRQRGEVGYSVQFKGGTVFSTHRIFMCPQINIVENDIVESDTERYQVQLVEKYYDFDNIHHLQLFARRLDNS